MLDSSGIGAQPRKDCVCPPNWEAADSLAVEAAAGGEGAFHPASARGPPVPVYTAWHCGFGAANTLEWGESGRAFGGGRGGIAGVK